MLFQSAVHVVGIEISAQQFQQFVPVDSFFVGIVEQIGKITFCRDIANPVGFADIGFLNQIEAGYAGQSDGHMTRFPSLQRR